MENDLKRIVCFVSAMNYGGAETFIMKLFRCLYLNNVKFDFIVSAPGKYDDEIKKLGGMIYIVPQKSTNFYEWFKQSFIILKNVRYDAALRMTSNSLGILDLVIAKMVGIKVLISRSTNANEDELLHKFLSKLFFFLPRFIPTCKIAPSIIAAEYLYGSKCVESGDVNILKNGIALKRFLFRKEQRVFIRQRLKIDEDTILIGHVGRFTRQKNQRFIVDILGCLDCSFKYKMLFIGNGEEKEYIVNEVIKRKLDDNTLFIDSTSEIEDYMMAMDILLLPSLYEGMPNVVIEAQAADLSVYASDRVTKEVGLTELVEFLPINMGDEKKWAKKIQSSDLIHNRDMGKANNKLKECGYDICDVSNNFLQYAFGDDACVK